jgi:predicted signal transduction protein with EAL and GGDEF domain
MTEKSDIGHIIDNDRLFAEGGICSSNAELLFSNIADAVILVDIDENFNMTPVCANSAFYANAIYADALERGDLLCCIVPEDRRRVTDFLKQNIASEAVFNTVFRISDPQNGGSASFCHARLIKLPAPDKNAARFFVALDNVTESMKKQIDLEESSNYLDAVNDIVGVFKVDLDIPSHPVIYGNDKFFGLLGYSDLADMKNCIDASATAAIHPDTFPHIREAIDKARKSEPRTVLAETKVITKSHASKWLLAWGNIVRKKKQTLFIGCAIDYSDMKNAEMERDAVIECMNGGFAVLKYLPEGNLFMSRMSDGFCSVLNDTRENLEKIYGGNVYNGVHPDDAEGVKIITDNALRGKTSAVPWLMRLKNSREEYVWVSTSRCVKNGANGEKLIYVSFVDVSGLKEIERRLRLSETAFKIAATQGGKSIERYDLKTKNLYQQTGFMAAFHKSEIVGNVPDSSVERGEVSPESIKDYLDFFKKMQIGYPEGSVTILMKSYFSGQYEWYRAKYMLMYDEDRRPAEAVISYVSVNKEYEKHTEKTNNPLPSDDAKPLMLVVDDDEKSRERLKTVFCGEYRIKEADNGESAMAALGEYGSDVSVMLLNIFMPVKNGFEVLKEMRAAPQYSQIAVIVIDDRNDRANELESIRLGAYEFLPKSTDEELIRYRVSFAVQKAESTRLVYENKLLNAENDKEILHQKELKHLTEFDPLTGLLNRSTFVSKAAEILSASKPEEYIIMVCDLDNFKVINDIYGHKIGDEVLQHFGSSVKKNATDAGGLCCHLSADNFAILYPNTPQNNEAFKNEKTKVFQNYDLPFNFVIRCGKYVVKGPQIPFMSMLDRAIIAKNEIKGKTDRFEAYYNDDMRKNILETQLLVGDAVKALDGNEFVIYLQPKYSVADKKIVGAEALVRWRHPQKGLLLPNTFIPVFEKNGLITKLDKYVWDKTAQYLRKRIDDGKNPVPISVNVSRVDIYNPDLVKDLAAIVRKYDIPPKLLELELTESAFTANQTETCTKLKQLRDRGFYVEMDDFGSGYSSLSALRNIEMDAIKLDIHFLPPDSSDKRGMSILSTVVDLAKHLRLDIIAEGVETEKQADYLASIGCRIAQGFFYSRPIDTNAFDLLI